MSRNISAVQEVGDCFLQRKRKLSVASFSTRWECCVRFHYIAKVTF
jgi:hypothetical protein